MVLFQIFIYLRAVLCNSWASNNRKDSAAQPSMALWLMNSEMKKNRMAPIEQKESFDSIWFELIVVWGEIALFSVLICIILDWAYDVTIFRYSIFVEYMRLYNCTPVNNVHCREQPNRIGFYVAMEKSVSIAITVCSLKQIIFAHQFLCMVFLMLTSTMFQ